jgi:hypothetical protein
MPDQVRDFPKLGRNVAQSITNNDERFFYSYFLLAGVLLVGLLFLAL